MRREEKNSHQHSKTNWLLSIDALCAAAYARHFSEVRAALLSQIKPCSARWSWVLDPFLAGGDHLVAALGGPIDPVCSLNKAESGLMQRRHWRCGFESHSSHTPRSSLTLTNLFFPRDISVFFQEALSTLSPGGRSVTRSFGRYFFPRRLLSRLCSPVAVFCLLNSPLSSLSIFVCLGLSEEGWDWKKGNCGVFGVSETDSEKPIMSSHP